MQRWSIRNYLWIWHNGFRLFPKRLEKKLLLLSQHLMTISQCLRHCPGIWGTYVWIPDPEQTRNGFFQFTEKSPKFQFQLELKNQLFAEPLAQRQQPCYGCSLFSLSLTATRTPASRLYFRSFLFAVFLHLKQIILDWNTKVVHGKKPRGFSKRNQQLY